MSEQSTIPNVADNISAQMYLDRLQEMYSRYPYLVHGMVEKLFGPLGRFGHEDLERIGRLDLEQAGGPILLNRLLLNEKGEHRDLILDDEAAQEAWARR